MIGSGSYVFFTDEVNFFKSMMVMGVGCIILSLEDIKDRIKEPEIWKNYKKAKNLKLNNKNRG